MAIYTCVLLDVDNTILDFDAAERQALTDMLAEYELPHDEAAYDTYHKVNRELWDSLAKGQLNKQKLFQIRFSRFMQTMQLPDNGKGKADIVKKAFFGPVTPEVPASILQMHPDFILVGDEEALSEI